jgi:hypothetical protein
MAAPPGLSLSQYAPKVAGRTTPVVADYVFESLSHCPGSAA